MAGHRLRVRVRVRVQVSSLILTLTLSLTLSLSLSLTLQRGVALGALLERLEVRGAGAEGAREELRRHHGAAEGLARAAVVEVEGGERLVRRRRLHPLELERRRRVTLARSLVLGWREGSG